MSMEPSFSNQGSASGGTYGGESSEGEGSARGLKEWWGRFKAGNRHPAPAAQHGKEGSGGSSSGRERPTRVSGKPVFSMPLEEAITYASITISTTAPDGEFYVWGVVPTVVARCGRYLKETATEVEGTFRVSGSSKRMKDIQAVFDSPPKYGKYIDWNTVHHTTHDVATIFRRFLTQMPEPVIPDLFYQEFRDTYSNQSQTPVEAIQTYIGLIERLPIPNKYLLLYVLDLLSVFEEKSEKNLMTATNLAVIFQPGILSHPTHHLFPAEHALNQKVVEFLILNQGKGFAPLLNSRLSQNPYRTKSSKPKPATSSSERIPIPSTSKPKPVISRPTVPLTTRLSDIFTASDSDDDFEGGVVIKNNLPYHKTYEILSRSKTTSSPKPSSSTSAKRAHVSRAGAGTPRLVTKDDLAATTKITSLGVKVVSSDSNSAPPEMTGLGGASVRRRSTAPSRRSVSGGGAGVFGKRRVSAKQPEGLGETPKEVVAV